MTTSSLLFPAAALAAFVFSTWFARYCTRPKSWFFVLDHPNERSSHTQPIPRTGGVGIVIAILLSGAVIGQQSTTELSSLGWLAGSILLLAITSFIDDRGELSPQYRLLVHVVVALLLCYGGFSLTHVGLPGRDLIIFHPYLVGVVTCFYIVWMINLYNFMDGVDGLAGGMAVVGFGTFSVLGFLAGDAVFAWLSLVVASAALGFLVFNFPPAKIFMGDTGSSVLGLLAAVFSIWASRRGVFDFWLSVLVFSVFIVDATVTLLRRIVNREKVWRPHRTHFYQRSVRQRSDHRRTTLTAYAIMIGCAISAIAVRNQEAESQFGVIGIWAGVYALIAFLIHRAERVTVMSHR